MDAMNMMNMANTAKMVNTINTVNAMNPVCRKENVFEGMHYRISVITEGLLRLEYSDDGTFEDRATQTVGNRKFPAAEFVAERGCKKLRITTRRLRLEYDEKRFSPEGLSITVTGDDRFPGREYGLWHFGEAAEDLGGTARTLDGADGPCPLGHGVISRKGYELLDDSHSLAVTEDGWVEPRREGICDLYFWGYGHDYKRPFSFQDQYLPDASPYQCDICRQEELTVDNETQDYLDGASAGMGITVVLEG